MLMHPHHFPSVTSLPIWIFFSDRLNIRSWPNTKFGIKLWKFKLYLTPVTQIRLNSKSIDLLIECQNHRLTFSKMLFQTKSYTYLTIHLRRSAKNRLNCEYGLTAHIHPAIVGMISPATHFTQVLKGLDKYATLKCIEAERREIGHHGWCISLKIGFFALLMIIDKSFVLSFSRCFRRVVALLFRSSRRISPSLFYLFTQVLVKLL